MHIIDNIIYAIARVRIFDLSAIEATVELATKLIRIWRLPYSAPADPIFLPKGVRAKDNVLNAIKGHPKKHIATPIIKVVILARLK